MRCLKYLFYSLKNTIFVEFFDLFSDADFWVIYQIFSPDLIFFKNIFFCKRLRFRFRKNWLENGLNFYCLSLFYPYNWLAFD